MSVPLATTSFLPQIASFIDHTLLKPEAIEGDIYRVCEEAEAYAFASVCVHPYWVPLCAARLARCPSRVCTVVGFPLGTNATKTKLGEARLAIDQGAGEIDMVQNVGALRSNGEAFVRDEISCIVQASHDEGVLVKVILETSLLTNAEIVTACLLAGEAGADFVKTSTGFGGAGATVEHVALMRKAVGPHMGVKASGGIRSLASLEAMVRVGATRIGTSNGVAILAELRSGAARCEGEAAY